MTKNIKNTRWTSCEVKRRLTVLWAVQNKGEPAPSMCQMQKKFKWLQKKCRNNISMSFKVFGVFFKNTNHMFIDRSWKSTKNCWTPCVFTSNLRHRFFSWRAKAVATLNLAFSTPWRAVSGGCNQIQSGEYTYIYIYILLELPNMDQKYSTVKVGCS